MPFSNLNDITANEIIPGFHGKFIHTDNVTVAVWEIEAGATLQRHAHPHEQITTVLEGRFELTVGDEKRIVEAGGVAVIPGDVPHAGRALTACRIIDVFHPARPEYTND
jgi:quercetin dioxygenase-like cupin family protein